MKNILRVTPQFHVQLVLDWKFVVATTFLVLSLRITNPLIPGFMKSVL